MNNPNPPDPQTTLTEKLKAECDPSRFDCSYKVISNLDVIMTYNYGN